MFKISKLPYMMDALEPHISKETLNYHYNKHHKGYVNKLNQLAKGTRYEHMELEEAVIQTSWVHGPESHRTGDSKPGREQYVRDLKIYNNSAQIWNHSFFWQCMSPEKTSPSKEVLSKINSAFGSLKGFKNEFEKAASDQFGSGWVWLIDDEGLIIEHYDNAITPLSFKYPEKNKILLCLDVWEHSYYLDYKNNRSEYVKTFLDKLLNWDFVEKRMAGAE
jgi:Fe-Mn family superoxide dismutase